jgi:hypothetical protein
MPRRALWDAIGLPESGSQLVGETFGLDQQGALAQALGLGAEMVLDPLTLGGMFLGAPAAKAISSPWQRGAQLDDAINALKGAQSSGLADIAVTNQVARSQLPASLAELNQIDLPGIAAGKVKNYQFAPDDVAAAFEQANLGVGTPAGGLSVFGSRLPGGSQLEPLHQFIGTKQRMAGRAVGLAPEGLPQLTPEELAWLSRQAPSPELGHTMAVDRLAGLMPPEPMMGQVAPGLGPELAGLPLRQGLNEIDALLPILQQEAQRFRMSPLDLGMIGGAGLGSIAGGLLGANQ